MTVPPGRGLVREASLAVTKHGLSVIAVGGAGWTCLDEFGNVMNLNKRPIYVDGKGPHLAKWLEYQKRLPSLDEIQRMFSRVPNMAIVCGKVSGGLEVIDFDAEGYLEKWLELLAENGYGELAERLVVQETQTPGHFHVLYRCPEGVKRNQALAARYPTDEEKARDPQVKKKNLIETRGEGGYIMAFPSPGYKMCRGHFGRIPVVTAAERGILLAAAAYFSEISVPEMAISETDSGDIVTEEPNRTASPGAGESELRPGDEYNARTEWSDILLPQGWQIVRRSRELTQWVRPGKQPQEGISAVSGLGRNGQDLLWVFTSNGAPLPAGKALSKFAAYSLFEFGGDGRAAARALYAKYHGERAGAGEKRVNDHSPAATGPLGPGQEPGIEAPKPSYFQFIKWSDLKNLPPKRMLVDGFLGVQDSVMVVGNRKAGKTAVIIDLLLSMISARTFAQRFEVLAPLNVAYFATEGKHSIPERVKAANSRHQIPDEILEETFHFCPVLPQLYIENHPGYFEHLVPTLLAFTPKIDVFVLDTFSKSTLGAEENSSPEMNQCLYNLELIRSATGATSIVNHHSNKAGFSRGATAIDADMDVQVWVDWDEATGDRKMRFGFAKDLPPWEDVPFDIHSVENGVPGSMRVEWDLTESRDKRDALSQVLRLMRSAPDVEWWPLGMLADNLDAKYDAIRIACKANSSPDGLLKWRQDGKAIEFQLRGRK